MDAFTFLTEGFKDSAPYVKVVVSNILQELKEDDPMSIDLDAAAMAITAQDIRTIAEVRIKEQQIEQVKNLVDWLVRQPKIKTP